MSVAIKMILCFVMIDYILF